MPVARQWQGNKQLLDGRYSAVACKLQLRDGIPCVVLENWYGSVVVICCCEKVKAEAGDSSGTQRKGNVSHWKPLPSNSSEGVIVYSSVCVSNSEL
jgi:hypothetical protein